MADREHHRSDARPARTRITREPNVPPPGEQRTESGGFVWPPIAPQPTPSRPTPQLPTTETNDQLAIAFLAALARPRTRLTRVIDACEDDWLDLTHPTLQRRAEEEAWFPDLPGAYCPRCGRTPDARGADALGCDACRQTRPPFERIIRLASYEGLLRDLVHELKFDARRQLGSILGRLLGLAIRHELALAAVNPREAVLVPMPTTFRRRMGRGIDHALVLARAVQQQTGGVIRRPISKRHRPSQLEVNPSERAANMARAFRPAWMLLTPLPRNAVVIVIDDVTTTGATIRGACRAVRTAWRRGALPGPKDRKHPVWSPGSPILGHRGGGGEGEPARLRVWAAVLGVTPLEPVPDGAGVGREESSGGKPDS